MSYAGLGIAPVIVAEAVSLGEKLFSSLFGSSPKPGNEKIIAGWATQVMQNPTAAAMPLTAQWPGGSSTPAPTPAWAWRFLRCWAGDHSVDAELQQFDPGYGGIFTTGCIGSDVAPEARTMVQQIRAAYPALAGPQIPGDTLPVGTYANNGVPSGTIPTGIPGLALPVGAGTVLGSTVLGVPMYAWAAGLVLLAFSGRKGH